VVFVTLDPWRRVVSVVVAAVVAVKRRPIVA
jgi:hypothetical protein